MCMFSRSLRYEGVYRTPVSVVRQRRQKWFVSGFSRWQAGFGYCWLGGTRSGVGGAVASDAASPVRVWSVGPSQLPAENDRRAGVGADGGTGAGVRASRRHVCAAVGDLAPRRRDGDRAVVLSIALATLVAVYRKDEKPTTDTGLTITAAALDGVALKWDSDATLA